MHDDLLELWEQLYYDKESTNKIIDQLVFNFENFFDTKDIGLIIISQYKSNSYFLEKMDYMDKIVSNCFNRIKKLTATDDDKVNNVLDFYPFGINDERYNGKYLTDNTQNAKNWIVGNNILRNKSN